MNTRDLQTSARLGGLALTAVLWLGCPPSNPGTTDGGPTGDAPQVALGVPDDNAVGTQLRLTLSVSGCDQVASLGLYDHGSFILAPSYAGPGTEVDLAPNQIPYNHQVAANLSLTAKVLCKDGRSNTSAPQAAHFLPVAQVITSPSKSQVVPDTFYAEGSGSSTVFVGCSEASGGQRFLIKVGGDGAVLATATGLPFACSHAASYSDRTASTGRRWMWEPGAGALAFDANLKVTSWTNSAVEELGLGPDGDAVVFVNSGVPALQRLPSLGGTSTSPTAPVWSHDISIQANFLANPVVNANGSVYIAYISVPGQNAATIGVDRLGYTNGQTAASNNIMRVSYGYGSVPPLPPVAFNADASIIYLTNQIADGQSQVIACSTSTAGCTGTGSLKWTSPVLTGNILGIIPFSQGSRIAVVTAKHTWFLMADTGATTGGGTIDPSGALVASGIQPGLGRDLYLFHGANTTDLPLEVVGIDNAEQGEVFRYGLLGGSLTGAVADDGQVWLRIGNNLVKPLPLSEYRLIH